MSRIPNGYLANKRTRSHDLRVSVSQLAQRSGQRFSIKTNQEPRVKSQQSFRTQKLHNNQLKEIQKSKLNARTSTRLSHQSDGFEVVSVDSIEMDNLKNFKDRIFPLILCLKKHTETKVQPLQRVEVIDQKPQSFIINKIQLKSKKNDKYTQLIKSRQTSKHYRSPKLSYNDVAKPMQVDLNGWSITSLEEL